MAVGGAHDGALVVRMARPPPVAGRAAEADRAAVAAPGVRRGQVTRMTGTTGRTEVLDADTADPGGLPVAAGGFSR
jgi:hypothetical protein